MTINLGSMIILKCAGIKKDMADLTASIHNLILSPINGDYDGDVLNFIAIFGKEFCELFDKFSPATLMLDPDTGGFSRDFLPAKDTILGLETLFNM